MPAISLCLQTVSNHLELSPLFVVVSLASISTAAGLCLVRISSLKFQVLLTLQMARKSVNYRVVN
jgi:hypothetical protein